VIKIIALETIVETGTMSTSSSKDLRRGLLLHNNGGAEGFRRQVEGLHHLCTPNMFSSKSAKPSSISVPKLVYTYRKVLTSKVFLPPLSMSACASACWNMAINTGRGVPQEIQE
jgi:hypothetical protein